MDFDGRGDGALADRGDVGPSDGSVDGAFDGSSRDGGDGAVRDGDVVVVDGCTPHAETCNGLDDDCNGQTDDGLGTTTCGVGECAHTVQNCTNGQSTTCTPGSARAEICDSLDNDCNGQTDEGLGSSTCGMGACARMTDNCVNGIEQTCTPGRSSSETCNGIDDNCNGMTDENLGSTTCGQGTCVQTIQNCVNGQPQVCTPLPSQPEACDSLDNNCDGNVDEGLGSTSCGVGACRRTVQNCVGGATQTCVAGLPGTEVCNNLDDDCDGMTDEDLGLVMCGVGACARQVPACINGSSQVCVPGTSSGEVCDGVDNNCDGQTDEGDPGGGASCGTGQPGICAAGTRHCFGGSLQCIANFNGMTPESCNGLDDNCNGVADEGLGTTTCGVGACQRTIQNCAMGMVQTCTAGNPTNETCNGIDDNCDGQTDEGLGSTSCGVGACRRTVQNCQNGLTQTCAAGDPATETCNGLDDDCNGQTDDNLGSTTCGLGACTHTQQNCVNGTTRACVPNPTSPEICDGIDNDCNGQTDEGVQNTYYRDTDGDGFGNATATIQACAPPTGYVADNTDCNDTAASVHPGAAETCNGVDDNCNGQVDEGVKSTFYRDADADGFGDVSASIQACSAPAGYVANSTDCDDTATSVHPGAAETCNLVDDNCNGSTDEGVQTTYYRDADRDNFGDPASSTQACVPPTGYVMNNTDCNDASAAVHPGAAELCNLIDDNCNGQVDENVQSTFYQDSDADGYGNLAVTTQACTAPAGYVANSTDCNDAVASVHPGAAETCNGVDDNCDGTIDEGVKTTYFRDADGDGFGNATVTIQACTAPTGYVSDSTDCNDAAASVHPGATEVCNGRDDDCDGVIDDGVKLTFYRDSDGDGYGNATSTTQACTAPTGYVSDNTDCNDTVASVHPGATETCNGVDDNCNGTTDEGVKSTFYRDADGDTYGNLSVTTQACTAPTGYVANSTDCNDAAASVHPGATETCNLVDDNCNGTTDEGVQTTFYRDSDADGYGNLSVTTQACTAPTGYVANSTDCNDAAASVHPGATETCNGVDDNCNGTIDEGVKTTYYRDADADGYGAAASSTQACTMPAGYVLNSTDCNDAAASVHPGATETCNGVDDNCDGTIDEGVKTTFYRDADGDTYGNASVTTQACTAPAGYVLNSTDCNDAAASVHPGATETCNLVDDNCNGTTDEGVQTTFYRDADSDTYGSPTVTTLACTVPAGYVTNNTDCNDANNTVHPGATETCNGVDDNCDGTIDEGVKTTFYRDADGDTYGNAASTTQACTMPAGYVANNTDCNDAAASVHPGAAETCNGVDDNCNGTIDEGVKTTFYQDADADGYGNLTVTTLACTMPAGYVLNSADCNDAAASVHPGATEVCNGVDDNCNGSIDEGVQSTFYRDADGDGYGNAAMPTTACSAPAGYVSNNTDCNDSNSAVRPGATETCNGVDDNCDGTVDNGGSALCPATNHVTTTACNGVSGCGITACNASFYNVDATYPDGCECADDTSGASCAAGSPITVSAVGSSARTGVLPFAGAEDWYAFSFPESDTFLQHGLGTPNVSISSADPNVRIDVQRACGTAFTCPGGGAATALTSWSFTDNADGSTVNTNYSSRTTTWPSTIWVRVYRTAGAATCNAYTLSYGR